MNHSYRVQILFASDWYGIGPVYATRQDAEWAIAIWRGQNGSNQKDTGFRVVELTPIEEDK